MYGICKPKDYQPRLVDAVIERKLKQFGGIEIEGTRACGKSWSAQAFGNSVTWVDLALPQIQAEPTLALTGEEPHVIDEWQDVPAIWNFARHQIDAQGNRPGQLILTGSSTPHHAQGMHSGAGRFGRIAMKTMTLVERGLSTKQVSLTKLFEGKMESFAASTSLTNLAEQICSGGWPIYLNNPQQNPNEICTDYFNRLFSRSLPEEGKRADIARAIALALARNDTASAKVATLASDAFGEDGMRVSRQTFDSYLTALKDNYFFYELPAWDAPIKATAKLRKKPKRYICDPSLTASLLHVNAERLVANYQLFGILFESLAIHDLCVYMSVFEDADWQPVRYFSNYDGLEVDAIVELADGRWGALEIKLDENKVDAGARNLVRLKKKVQENKAAHNQEPSFLAVVLGSCTYAYQRPEDGVFVFPLNALTV